MHSNSTSLVLGHVQELSDDGPARAAAIPEVQVNMPDALLREAAPIIAGLVQAHCESNTSLEKHRDVVLGCEGGEALRVKRCRRRPGEGQELPRDDPVHVAVLDLLVEVVRLRVKPVQVEPPMLDTFLKSLETVCDRQLESAHAAGGIAKGEEGRVDGAERLIRHLNSLSKRSHLVGAHQARRVGPLLGVVGAEVDDAFVGKARIQELGLEHLAITVDHRQI
mmetsp:Transcript_70056/g.204969  ORF Transcript_70056/g.204969 Transcript_70056/m.204969 type:complete len:222 (+) Transcript_70056:654-1319(+)